MPTRWWKLPIDKPAANKLRRALALNLAHLFAGGMSARPRAMVTEKMAAHVEVALTLLTGGSPAMVVRRYRALVRANDKRLANEPC